MPVNRVAKDWDRVVDPRPLAAARIGVGVAALMTFVEIYFRLSSVTEGDLAMPLTTTAMPELRTGTVVAFLLVSLGGSVALILGAHVRVAGLAVTSCAWFGFAWEQQTYSNHMMLTAWLALWLALVPCDAAWAIKSRHTRGRVATWGDQFLVMTQVSVCYLFAAIVKLNPGFLSGQALRGYVDQMPDLPNEVWPVLGVATVTTELALAVCLWLPRARWLVAPGGVLLHLSIVLAMRSDAWALTAFSVACVSQYPMFLADPDSDPEAADRSRSAGRRRPQDVLR